MYPKAWHSLLLGEDDATIAKVKGDIIQWLQERTTAHTNGHSKR